MTRTLQGAIGIGLLLGLGVSACSSSGHATSSATTTTSVPATTASSAPATSASTATTTSTSTTSPRDTAPSGPGQCATSALKGSLTNSSGTAGSIYYDLVLTNESSDTCLLEGYPGVSFVYGNQGQQVGAPAARNTGTVAVVTLAPGASAHATLQITVASNYGQCGLTNTDGLRVYPPNQLTALLIVHHDQACSDTKDVTLHVGPLEGP